MTQSKERPILFSGPMVRAILEGRKSQTRRIVREQDIPFVTNVTHQYLSGEWDQRPLPYGQIGDRLWVRETWRETENMWGYKADNLVRPKALKNTDALISFFSQHCTTPVDALKWRPSIHMPRLASRLLLEVTNVRVERLQEISVNDALEEGITRNRYGCHRHNEIGGCVTMIEGFMELWDSINAQRGYGWDTNPWVWVVKFKRVTQ